jgi:ribonuclease R
VVEILGQPGDFGVDVEAVIRKHHLPNHFPPEVVEQAARVPANRRCRSRRPPRFSRDAIVTIDGETARDFDDAVWVDQARQLATTRCMSTSPTSAIM